VLPSRRRSLGDGGTDPTDPTDPLTPRTLWSGAAVIVELNPESLWRLGGKPVNVVSGRHRHRGNR